MSNFLFAIAIAGALCLGHAAITKRWDLFRGGVPFVAVFAVLGLILSF
jgi:hypothetical protein